MNQTLNQTSAQLQPHTASDCKQPPGVIVPAVDLKRCEGKGDCLVVCPEDVFEIRRIDAADYQSLGVLNKLKLRVHGMHVAYTPKADACRACGLCVTACPERAITLVRAA
jgi:NAD-dependent dihydropyrimidine dehydrogenase PreA subunit